MADTNPENEVHDGPSAHHTVGVSPYPYPGRNEVSQAANHSDESNEGTGDEQDPPKEGLAVFNHSADPFSDPVV